MLIIRSFHSGPPRSREAYGLIKVRILSIGNAALSRAPCLWRVASGRFQPMFLPRGLPWRQIVGRLPVDIDEEITVTFSAENRGFVS
jgi:hypothetical protein